MKGFVEENYKQIAKNKQKAKQIGALVDCNVEMVFFEKSSFFCSMNLGYMFNGANYGVTIDDELHVSTFMISAGSILRQAAYEYEIASADSSKLTEEEKNQRKEVKDEIKRILDEGDALQALEDKRSAFQDMEFGSNLSAETKLREEYKKFHSICYPSNHKKTNSLKYVAKVSNAHILYFGPVIGMNINKSLAVSCALNMVINPSKIELTENEKVVGKFDKSFYGFMPTLKISYQVSQRCAIISSVAIAIFGKPEVLVNELEVAQKPLLIGTLGVSFKV